MLRAVRANFEILRLEQALANWGFPAGGLWNPSALGVTVTYSMPTSVKIGSAFAVRAIRRVLPPTSPRIIRFPRQSIPVAIQRQYIRGSRHSRRTRGRFNPPPKCPIIQAILASRTAHAAD
jgi:hypothetical protein